MFVYFSHSWLPYQILSTKRLSDRSPFQTVYVLQTILLLLMRLLLILLTNDLSQQNNLSEPIVEVFLETRCDKLSAVVLSYSLFSREPSRCRLHSATMERSHYCPNRYFRLGLWLALEFRSFMMSCAKNSSPSNYPPTVGPTTSHHVTWSSIIARSRDELRRPWLMKGDWCPLKAPPRFSQFPSKLNV